MAGALRKKRVPSRTRETLIATAGKLFAEHGFDQPSLDTICEAAGYTRGAFYVHFSSRDELVGAVVEKTLTELLDAIAPEDASDVTDVIAAFVTALREGRVPATGGPMRISQLLEACSRSWDLRVRLLAILVAARHRIESVVRRGQAECTIEPAVNATAAAEMLLALVLGLQVAAQLGVPYDAERVQRELERWIRSSPKKKRRSK